jgi:hypothetical protein
MSRKLNDQDIQEIAALLSAERLAALTQLTGSPREAVELHQQILQLGASLMSVTAVIEIALRNAICARLTTHFGAAGWLLHPPAPFRWRNEEKRSINRALAAARRAVYAKMSQAEKHALDTLAYPTGRPANLKHSERSLARQAQIKVTEGKVVAELTLFFWKRLFSDDYEEALWKTSLKRTFPNKKLRRADVALQLERIYQTRNRLAHHEPVCERRFQEAVAAINFVTRHLGADGASDDTPLAKLIFGEMEIAAAQGKALDERLALFRKAAP